jgi:protein-S-isoprenylcysteine O-methyltransferase Ste14
MKAKNGEHPFGDSGQLILLISFVVIWVADSFTLQLSTFLSAYIPLTVRLTLLVLLLAPAVCLIKSGHAVVTHAPGPSGIVSTGAFHYVRHPLYLGSIMFYLGLAVSTASLVSFAFVAVITTFYNYIAGYEEKLMEQRFGEAYRIYKSRTGKWLPMTGKKDEGRGVFL